MSSPIAPTGAQPVKGGSWAFGFWGAVLLLAAVFGLGMIGLAALTNLGTDTVDCGGQPMSSQYKCVENGETYTYKEMIDKRDNLVARNRDWTRIGSILLVAAGSGGILLLGIGAVVKRRTTATPQALPPAQISDLTERYDLGEFHRSYRAIPSGLTLPVGGLVVAGVGVTLIVVDALSASATVVTGIVAGLCVLYALVGVVRAVIRSKNMVYRFAEGLIVVGRGKPEALQWSAVDELCMEHTVLNDSDDVMSRYYRLTGRKFSPVEFKTDVVADLEDLAGQLLSRIAEAQLPAALTRLAAEVPLSFGSKITADRQGATISGHCVPWDAVNRGRITDISDYAFPVSGIGDVKIPQRDIVNLPLLMALAQRLA